MQCNIVGYGASLYAIQGLMVTWSESHNCHELLRKFSGACYYEAGSTMWSYKKKWLPQGRFKSMVTRSERECTSQSTISVPLVPSQFPEYHLSYLSTSLIKFYLHLFSKFVKVQGLMAHWFRFKKREFFYSLTLVLTQTY